MRAKHLLILAIFLGAFLMSRNVLALTSETKDFIGCNVIEEDPDFLINITNCNETLVSGELTFNPLTVKNSLTGWFNVSGDYMSSGQFTIRKSIINKIPFALYLKDFKIELSKINLLLKWGISTATVSVTQNSVYRVNGNDNTYSVDFQKSSCTNTAPCGVEANLTIFQTNFPRYSSNSKAIGSGGGGTGYINISSSSLIEYGPVRVVIYFVNNTNNFIAGTNTILNWTQIVYAYPKYYQNYYNFSANNTIRIGPITTSLFDIYKTTATGTDNPRFDEWNNRTINGTNYLYSIDVNAGADNFNLGSNTLAFYYDDTDHNKTVLTFKTQTNTTSSNNYASQDISERMQYGIYSSSYENTPRYIGYAVMFGQSGATTVENNQTVWNADFEEQYRAWYNPATMTAIVGTQKSRNNITGSYNYTANGTMADFNFTTVAGMNYTYPVFEIENISNISAIKVFWKNYTASANWVQLTNWTDYVLQEGNSSFFGYKYILLLINKTLGKETAGAETYEFMVNNTTTGGGTTTFERMFNVSNKVYLNVPSRITNILRFLSVATRGSLNSVRVVNLSRLLSIAVHGSDIFSGIYSVGIQVLERFLNIVDRNSMSAIRNIASIRNLTIATHGLGQFSRNVILNRIVSMTSRMSSNFLRILIAGATTFERWFNTMVRGSSNFIRSSSITAWFNVREKAGSIFQRIVSLSKMFSQGMSMSTNMLGNSIKTRFLNIFVRESAAFMRGSVVSRMYSNMMKIEEKFNGIFQTLFNYFERILSIPFKTANRFVIAARTWIEPSVYQVCSILQQIGDSRAYLCIYDTGEWKILIRGV